MKTDTRANANTGVNTVTQTTTATEAGTRVKRQRSGLLAWLCFFIGLNIIFLIIAAPLVLLINTTFNDFQYIDDFADLALSNNLQDSTLFKTILAEYMDTLLELSKRPGSVSGVDSYRIKGLSQLEYEYTNIACFVQNKDGVVIYDTLPEEAYDYKYDNLLILQDNDLKLYISKDDDLLSKYRAGEISKYYGTSVYYNLSNLRRNVENFKNKYIYSEDIKVVLAFRSDIENFPNSVFNMLHQVRLWIRIGAISLIVLIVFALFLIIYSSVKREDKRRFLRRYADSVAKIWFEVKVLVIIFVSFFSAQFLDGVIYHYWSHSYIELAIVFVILIALFWFFYLVIKDLQYNKSEFFKQNSIRTLARVFRRLAKRLPFERRMLVGFWVFAVAELVLISLCVLTFPAGLLTVLYVIIGVVLFLVATLIFHKFISDVGGIVTQISRIKSGDLKTRIDLGDQSDLREHAENLNSIQSGMSKALEEQLASERLKIDLITNVSHDLKTPLTSIISYIDLLKKEELPPEATEYTEVLSEKADRLNTMIQDIFDVSKATSGNLDVEEEVIELGRLVDQTLADMQEKVEQSGLIFRVHHSDKPLYVRSDGQKLYRVFQNLIDNALSYSLDGSRVHIRLWSENSRAMVEIKNTSSHELNFTQDEITERFTRGDVSRTGEGSGLGLSIAQTFTEACGGTFKISTEYDDFKVRLTFDLERGNEESSSDESQHVVAEEVQPEAADSLEKVAKPVTSQLLEPTKPSPVTEPPSEIESANSEASATEALNSDNNKNEDNNVDNSDSNTVE